MPPKIKKPIPNRKTQNTKQYGLLQVMQQAECNP
jgi:hypothetical protein